MRHVERTVELEATPDEVWTALTDDARRAEWLDDGTHRMGGVEESVENERLTFRWYDGTDGSRVTFTLEPVDGDHTRLTVRETQLAGPGRGRALAMASV